MFENLAITNYHVDQAKKYSLIGTASAAALIILANIIYALFGSSISVSEKSFTQKEGFPFFTSSRDYVEFVKKYPYDAGVKLKIHRVGPGESLWSIAHRYSVRVDTIIAANHYLESLSVKEGSDIVIPNKDGVLFAFENIFQVWKMKDRLEFHGEILGRYRPAPYRIWSKDDMRLAFFPEKSPVLVSKPMESLYRIKNIFQPPTVGKYSSMFGDRVDPLHHEYLFHNGIDIYNRTGTTIRPVREGIVSYTGWREGYGLSVIVMHRDGYSSLYAHCSSLKTKVGDWVTKEDTIALMGSTGRSTGSHLHFTVYRHGRLINPIFFIW